MPGRWLVLTVRVPSEEQTHELTEGLVALGGTAVEEDADLLTTYVPEPEELTGRVEAVEAGLAKQASTVADLRQRA